MNQQVYKLALQAGFSSWELDPSKETMSDTPEKIKKLAELIVRECRKVIIDDMNSNPDDEAFNDALDHAQSIIGEHFGVEE